jgi:hypothetical protein
VKRLLEKASSDFQQESGILELFFALWQYAEPTIR